MSLLNRVKVVTATTGTGTVTLGAAVAMYQTFAAANAVADRYYPYLILDGASAWEVGLGLYDGTHLTRPGPGVDTSFASSTGALLNLAGPTTVACVENGALLSGFSVGDMAGQMRPLADFTQINIGGTITLTETPGKAVLIKQSTPDAVLRCIGLRKAAPATPYRVAMFVQVNAPAQDFVGPLWGFSDGTQYDVMQRVATQYEHETWTNSTTRASATSLITLGRNSLANNQGFWIGARDDGTNVWLEESGDGVNFTTILKIVKSTGFLGASGYTNIFGGAFIYNGGSIGGSDFPCSVNYRAWDENGLTRAL